VYAGGQGPFNFKPAKLHTAIKKYLSQWRKATRTIFVKYIFWNLIENPINHPTFA
jgi:hypothetical protein